jgi:hypothetical protein
VQAGSRPPQVLIIPRAGPRPTTSACAALMRQFSLWTMQMASWNRFKRIAPTIRDPDVSRSLWSQARACEQLGGKMAEVIRVPRSFKLLEELEDQEKG